MAEAAIARLSTTPWCAALISSPDWVPVNTVSRIPKSNGEDSFFAETLATPRGVQTCLTLRPTKELDGRDGSNNMVFGEVMVIIKLGDGLNGHAKIVHGGFAATMLDEALGALITLNAEARMKRKERLGELGPHEAMACFTAYLNTSYKKPVPAPGILLCKARFERRERNKIYLSGSIEDGRGTVFTTCEGMFVEVKTDYKL
ncbi:hypothetical protein CC80DRAFT_489902 [Byssothecium circinans]|uniref:Thioesterase domain-containing protein n=1 Tax=Byssothecium circinans TaxID=147558 RepID=A0A6A5U7J3_9PLEO|nr:hypothetical protein CC80DRAFT_489902 [Byssothecium circinans]